MWDLPDDEQGFDAASTEFSPDDRLSLGRLCVPTSGLSICPASGMLVIRHLKLLTIGFDLRFMPKIAERIPNF
jgi:hypothetical protein